MKGRHLEDGNWLLDWYKLSRGESFAFFSHFRETKSPRNLIALKCKKNEIRVS